MNDPTPAPRVPSVEDAGRDCPRCGNYSCNCFDERYRKAEYKRTPEPYEESFYELPEDAEYRERLERKMQEEKR